MNLDARLFLLIHNLRRPWLDGPMGWLSKNGYLWVWLLLAALLLVYRRRAAPIARDGVLSFLLAIMVAEEWLKPLIHRTRPPHAQALHGLVHVLGSTPPRTSFSFPSGTSAACFVGATVLWLALGRRAGIAGILLAITVALSRAYVGVHYPGDLIGGAVVGVLVTLGVRRFSAWAGVGAGTLGGKT